MMEMSNLIADAVARKLTPEFIEKEIDGRVAKLVTDAVDSALRSYSDTGKLIEKAVAESLRVDRLDLPTYGAIVTTMLKAQIEARVAPLVAGRLAADMEELLSLAPKEVKLSQIADEMRKRHEGEGYGPVITVIVEHSEYRSTWIYLDEDEHRERRDKHRCRHSLLVGEDGTISSIRTDGRESGQGLIGRAYGLEQKLRAYLACGTTIVIDEDYVSTSVGDY